MNALNGIRLIVVNLLISLAISCSGNKSPKLIAILSLFTDSTDKVTYTISGAIQGLIGTIVLQNNGAETLTVSADGNFTFSTALTDGSAYSITVLTQPTGQTCIASSNTGIMNGSNITNISITCTTNTYTVSGNISGLVGTVVLQNNAGDNLTLSANGSFTFATSVAHGANYLVSVFTQPLTVTCSTSSNSGTINAANVTNVSVVCSNATYTVGGNLSGLVGTVVLQNNSGDDLTLSANGSFTFATSIADGGNYSVTVFTQPTSQTCTRSNHTGTLSGSNITNVSITCTTNTYTVGGNVSGLSGTVVLQNNSGDNLTLSANGSFTFATSLLNTDTYSVTVFSQPASQNCIVLNSAGTISLASVTNISVTCTNIYTIGGSVSGLVGTVVLQNNSGDNLSVAANGSFTFATGLANATAYSVTVLTQPATRNCVITNGTGTISSANVTNITVTCTGNANGPLVSGSIINTLTLSGGVTTFAGAPCAANTAGCAGPSGYVDSTTASSVRFNGAEGITTDGFYLYVADKANQRIRKVSIATGETTTLAGDGTKALLNGTGTAARFNDPRYLVTDGVNIYVSDKANKAIRKIVIATAVVTTIISGNANLADPKGMAIYNNYLYIGDNSGNAIRQIDLTTNTLTTVIPSGLNDPTSFVIVGNEMYISDKNSDTIKKTTIGTWTVSTFAGTVSGFADGTGTTSVMFKNPEDITTDGVNLYVSDTGNNAIRKIVISSTVVTTLAGTNTANYTNSSTPTTARFDSPRGITSDGANLYVLDKNNNAIRLIQ